MKIGRDMALVLLAAVAPVAAGAQDLRSGPYQLPYKNTYVKEVFVPDNETRDDTAPSVR